MPKLRLHCDGGKSFDIDVQSIEEALDKSARIAVAIADEVTSIGFGEQLPVLKMDKFIAAEYIGKTERFAAADIKTKSGANAG